MPQNAWRRQQDGSGTVPVVSGSFQDHFSGHAAEYSRHRPGYPAELFSYLAELAPRRERAWDCATGNGQAARALAEHFAEVVATDASEEQLAHAEPHPRVRYRAEPAEATSLAPGSCDLVTVAQALHWFEWDAFYAEVRRVARPGGVLAAWTYPLMQVGGDVDRLLTELHGNTVAEFWPAERAHVDARYSNLPFPFREIEPPAVEMSCEWTVEQTLAYLGTWSAVRRFRAARGSDPVARIASDLARAWGTGRRRVRWPLIALVGRVE